MKASFFKTLLFSLLFSFHVFSMNIVIKNVDDMKAIKSCIDFYAHNKPSRHLERSVKKRFRKCAVVLLQERYRSDVEKALGSDIRTRAAIYKSWVYGTNLALGTLDSTTRLPSKSIISHTAFFATQFERIKEEFISLQRHALLLDAIDSSVAAIAMTAPQRREKAINLSELLLNLATRINDFCELPFGDDVKREALLVLSKKEVLGALLQQVDAKPKERELIYAVSSLLELFGMRAKQLKFLSNYDHEEFASALLNMNDSYDLLISIIQKAKNQASLCKTLLDDSNFSLHLARDAYSAQEKTSAYLYAICLHAVAPVKNADEVMKILSDIRNDSSLQSYKTSMMRMYTEVINSLGSQKKTLHMAVNYAKEIFKPNVTNGEEMIALYTKSGLSKELCPYVLMSYFGEIFADTFVSDKYYCEDFYRGLAQLFADKAQKIGSAGGTKISEQDFNFLVDMMIVDIFLTVKPIVAIHANKEKSAKDNFNEYVDLALKHAPSKTHLEKASFVELAVQIVRERRNEIRDMPAKKRLEVYAQLRKIIEDTERFGGILSAAARSMLHQASAKEDTLAMASLVVLNKNQLSEFFTNPCAFLSKVEKFDRAPEESRQLLVDERILTEIRKLKSPNAKIFIMKLSHHKGMSLPESTPQESRKKFGALQDAVAYGEEALKDRNSSIDISELKKRLQQIYLNIIEVKKKIGFATHREEQKIKELM